MGMNVTFEQADVCSLPFDDGQFDLILAESVTVFTDTAKSLPEYYRVLDDGGTLLDRELLLDKPMPEPQLQELLAFFGIPNLMLREQWSHSLLSSGFQSVDALEYNHFTEQLKEEQTRHLDTFEQRDKGILFDQSLWETLFKHDRMILDNTDYLASALFKAVK
ncbi:ubiquinone/menaquinone biosynthesis methyltransferase UbiE [Paenibacillus sp. JCM 10914]|nr:class I SAM-dependent methyltransferase [Paenibacillus sp. JCM 10914]GAE08517.1 ubiquinone/menaquinone biosynthesis methyltransferase UbiE [Paenibacillus sp. JCM 10914]